MRSDASEPSGAAARCRAAPRSRSEPFEPASPSRNTRAARLGGFAILASTVWSFPAIAETAAQGMPTQSILAPQRMLIILFLLLGPVKVLFPFIEMTRHADPAFRRQLAGRAILVSAAALVLAGVLGDEMAANFQIPLPVLALAGGLILFLVALNTVLEQFSRPVRPASETEPPNLKVAVGHLAFPTIVTPSGVAAIIIFSALAKDEPAMLAIVGITLVMLLLDWLTMVFAEPISKWGGLALQLFAVVLCVIQVGFGLELMLRSLSLMGVLPERVSWQAS